MDARPAHRRPLHLAWRHLGQQITGPEGQFGVPVIRRNITCQCNDFVSLRDAKDRRPSRAWFVVQPF